MTDALLLSNELCKLLRLLFLRRTFLFGRSFSNCTLLDGRKMILREINFKWEALLLRKSTMIQRPLHWITECRLLSCSWWRTAHSLPLLKHAMCLSLMVLGLLNRATSIHILIKFLFLVNKGVTALRTRILVFSLRTILSSFRLFSYKLFKFRFPFLGLIIRSLLLM